MEIAKILEAINEIKSRKNLERNYQGQLLESLNLIPSRYSNELALEYATHTIWIFSEIEKDSILLRDSILATRNYLDASKNLAKVEEFRKSLYKTREKLSETENYPQIVARNVIHCVIMAIESVVKRDLEAERLLMYSKKPIKTKEVAAQASYTVARFYGGASWNSSNKSLKKAARRIGQRHSQQERKWQLEYTIEYLRKHID